MRHAAICVHTLGTGPDAAVVAFGISVFDNEEESHRQLIAIAIGKIFTIINKTDGMLLIRKDDVDILNNIVPGYRLNAVDIDDVIDASGIPRSTIVVCPKFYEAAHAASADGATLRALFRVQESIRTKDAA